ncbi:MAG: hypothetical protein ACRD0L_16780 [Acidimicrobiales bacterium]
MDLEADLHGQLAEEPGQVRRVEGAAWRQVGHLLEELVEDLTSVPVTAAPAIQAHEEGPCQGSQVAALVTAQTEAQVGELGPAVWQEDDRSRIDAAVDDPGSVRDGKRIGQVGPDPGGALHRQRPASSQGLGQRLARCPLAHGEGPPVVLPQVIDADQGRVVLDRCGRLEAGQEAGPSERIVHPARG